MKNFDLSPIVLFTYNRIDFLVKTVASLKRNKESKDSYLFIFSDGAKNNAIDKKKVLYVRKFIRNIKGFKKIFIEENDKNKGLSKNIIGGITKIVNKYNRAIIIEDDIEVSRYFLKYMNNYLNIYKNDKRVASIHGWSFPIDFKKEIPDFFFIRGADCWGWGTWKRSWKKFNPDGKKLLYQIKDQNLEKLFNLNNSYDYLKMLEDQVEGKNDSWAIRWHASIFLKNMYTLYPKISLVNNLGTKQGTHSNFDILNFGKRFVEKKYYRVSKQEVREDLIVKKEIEDFFKKNYFYKIIKYFKKFIILKNE
jgi:hypothetical protein